MTVSRTGLRRRLKGHDGVVALAIYLGVALFWYRAAVGHMSSACTCSLPGDAASVTWALAWFPHALFHGLNLLHTKAMWTPTGINLAGATTIPLIAVLMAPVTSLWGPIVAYNVVTIAAPVAGAWCAYRLCRYATKSLYAAIIAGTIYGFGTYEIAQNGGHVQMAVTFVPPLAALCVLRFLDGASSKRRFGIEMTVLLTAQMFMGTELLFTMTILGAVALALWWVLGPLEGRPQLRSAALVIAAAFAITLVFSCWYVYALLQAPAYAKDRGFSFPTDLLSFFTPMPYTWIGGSLFTGITGKFAGQAPETNAYLGVPLILIAFSVACSCWNERAVKLLSALLVISVVWVLGQNLYVLGVETVPLPYLLLAYLPGFNELLQGRIALYVELLCAVILAIWLATPSRRAVLRWSCGLLAVAFVLPNLINPSQRDRDVWTNPRFFASNMYKHYLRQGETIMPISWAWFSEAPMWQAEDRMYYNTASGYFLADPPTSWQDQLTEDLWNGYPPRAGDWRFVRPFVRRHRVSAVVVQSNEIDAWGPTLQAAGLRATVTIGGVSVYPVPAAWLRAE
jgi:hypothetical protein